MRYLLLLFFLLSGLVNADIIVDKSVKQKFNLYCTYPTQREDNTDLTLLEINKIIWYSSVDQITWNRIGGSSVACRFTIVSADYTGINYFAAKTEDTEGRVSMLSSPPFKVTFEESQNPKTVTDVRDNE